MDKDTKDGGGVLKKLDKINLNRYRTMNISILSDYRHWGII